MNLFWSKRRVRNHKVVLASRTTLLISVIVPLSFARLADGSPVPKKPSESRFIVEQGLANLVDLVFLFDRLFTKSTTATSPDYLERVSEPSSKFYPDYLEYKQGRISRAELVRRLPHVALISTSGSKNFYISSVPSMYWRARTEQRKNWFLDTDFAPDSVYSLYERIDKLTPLVATESAGTGAFVTAQPRDETFDQILFHTRNFWGQVDEVLKAKRFPDLLLLWMGHNNLDWVTQVPPNERQRPEKQFAEIAKRFRQDYTRQMRRLISRAERQDYKVAIVVFGLPFETGFKARETAEALKARNPKLYPYLETGYRYFESSKPENRQDTIRLERMFDRELKDMVRDLRDELGLYPNVRLQYSDALAKPLSDVAVLEAHDAWHLSPKGHNREAQAAFTALGPSLHFLGIELPDEGSRRSQLHQ